MTNEANKPFGAKEQRLPYTSTFADNHLHEIISIVRASYRPEVEIVSRPEWQYLRDRYLFTALLVDNKIALFVVQGHVHPADCQAVSNIMKQLIASAGNKQLFHILDLSGISSFSLAARKAYAAIAEELQPHWIHSYYIFSALGGTLFKLYTSLRPSFSQQVTLADSITEAISYCRDKGLDAAMPHQFPKDPGSLSHEELLLAYRQLQARHEQLQQTHSLRADELIQLMSRITWEEDFQPTANPLPQDDPFFNVFNSLTVLKDDLREMFEQQRKAQQTLEEEVARQTWRFSSVIENTSEMIMSVDRNWKVQVLNSAFQQHFRHFQQSEVQVGDNLLAIYDEAGTGYWKPRFDRAFEGDGFCEIITDGTEEKKTFYELTFNPIRHIGEEVVSEVSVFARDVSALRRAEETARENEKNLIRSLQIARAGSWELDLLSGEVIIGKEGLQVIGYSDHQELRLSMDEFIEKLLHPEDVPLVQERIAYAMQNIENPDFQDQFPYRLFHKDGYPLYLMLYSRFKSGQRGVIYGITQDISEQKEAQDQLLMQNEALRKVNGELDRFVYSVSHDLRAPLASVLGLINIARNETDPKQQLHYLDLQEKSIQKLDNFIREIIDLSKNSRLEVSREEVDFQKLVSELYDAQYYDAAASEVRKLFHIEQQVPFYSDYRRLYVVMNNLVSNSLRYANLKQEAPFVRINIRVDSSQATISVEDNGMGIAANQLPHIFKMFYRANEYKTGSGLGLYIVQETLEKLKGRIEVQSKQGEGTKFILYLPQNA